MNYEKYAKTLDWRSDIVGESSEEALEHLFKLMEKFSFYWTPQHFDILYDQDAHTKYSLLHDLLVVAASSDRYQESFRIISQNPLEYFCIIGVQHNYAYEYLAWSVNSCPRMSLSRSSNDAAMYNNEDNNGGIFCSYSKNKTGAEMIGFV